MINYIITSGSSSWSAQTIQYLSGRGILPRILKRIIY